MIVVIGLGIIAALFMLLAFKLDEQHQVIKVTALIFSILSMLAISSSVLNNQDHCEILVNYTNNVYVYGSNFTGYHWDYDYDLNPAQAPDYEIFHVKQYYTYDRFCFDNPAEGSGLSVFKLMNYFIRILQWYALVFIIYWIFNYFGIDLLQKARDLFKK